MAVSTWFASERWAFQQHEGKKWLSDIIIEAMNRFLETALLRRIGASFTFTKVQLKKSIAYMRRVSSKAGNLLPTHISRAENASLPETQSSPMGSTDSPLFRATTETKRRRPSLLPRALSMPNLGNSSQDTESNDPPRSPRELWDMAFSGILTRPTLSQVGFAAVVGTRESHRQLTTSSNFSCGPRRETEEQVGQLILKSRITSLMSELKPLEVTQDLAAHEALVRYLEFSPNGKYLATSR